MTDKVCTIYEIKERTKEKSPCFFSHKTMEFFGQTMKSFKVRTSPAGNIYIFAPLSHDGRHAGYTFRQFADNDLKHIHIEGKWNETLTDIKQYIKEH